MNLSQQATILSEFILFTSAITSIIAIWGFAKSKNAKDLRKYKITCEIIFFIAFFGLAVFEILTVKN